MDFVRGIHRWSADSPHKAPVSRKMFPFMTSSCSHSFLWDVITHSCRSFHGYLVQLQLKLGRGWVITSHSFLITYALPTFIVTLSNLCWIKGSSRLHTTISNNIFFIKCNVKLQYKYLSSIPHECLSNMHGHIDGPSTWAVALLECMPFGGRVAAWADPLYS